MVLYTDQTQYDHMGAVFINVQRLIYSLLSIWIVIVCMVSSLLLKTVLLLTSWTVWCPVVVTESTTVVCGYLVMTQAKLKWLMVTEGEQHLLLLLITIIRPLCAAFCFRSTREPEAEHPWSPASVWKIAAGKVWQSYLKEELFRSY